MRPRGNHNRYDSLNRVTSASSTAGWTQAFDYDGFGSLWSQTMTGGSATPMSVNLDMLKNRINTAGWSYDNNGNTVAMPTSGGYAALEYDVDNRLTKWTGPAGEENYRYLPDNKRVWKKAPGGAETTYGYVENATTVTDPANVKKTLVTDALGRLVSVTEDPGGLGLVTNYFYDAAGNLLTVCPSGGTLSATGVCTGTAQARTFTYDWLGRILTVSNPESSVISYVYDEAASTNGVGQLTSKSQVRGVVAPATVTTRFHYDALGRMTSKVYTGAPDGVSTATVTYSYDAHNPVIAGVTSYAKGRRTRVEVAGGVATTVDSFDAMGRATRSSQGTYRFGSDSLEGYEYLRNGAVSVMRLPTGRTLTYAFHPDYAVAIPRVSSWSPGQWAGRHSIWICMPE